MTIADRAVLVTGNVRVTALIGFSYEGPQAWSVRRHKLKTVLRPPCALKAASGGAATIPGERCRGAAACSGGWVAILVTDGEFADSLFAPTFAQLLGKLGGAAAIGVDIPIGLPSEGVRAADFSRRDRARRGIRPALHPEAVG
jgi:hypothetical protein